MATTRQDPLATRRREHPLTREEIVDTALGIVDAEGLDALSMRRLAATLGVEAMSLYHHLSGKAALLDATVDRMRSEMRLPEIEPADWAEALAAVFVEYRRVLIAHPNMLPLAARRTGSAGMSGLHYLVERGMDPDDAVELYQSLVAFTIGFSVIGSPMVEASWGDLPPGLGERMRDWREDTFRRTLRIVMDGYRSDGGE